MSLFLRGAIARIIHGLALGCCVFAVANAQSLPTPPELRAPTQAERQEFGDLAPQAVVLQDVLDRAYANRRDFNLENLAWARAIVAAQDARGLTPERRLQRASILKLLGRVVLALNGDTPEALAAFSAALEADPTDKEAATEKQLLETRFAEVTARLRQAEDTRKAEAANGGVANSDAR